MQASSAQDAVGPAVTDTLRFLAIPGLTTAPATAAEPTLIDVPDNAERAQQGDLTSHAMWSYRLSGDGELTGLEAHFWMRIDRQVVNSGAAPGACAWALWVEVLDPAGEIQFGTRPCVTDDPVLPAGDHEVVFDIPFQGPVAVGPGWTLGVGLDIGPFDPAAPGAIRLASGTPELDSRLVWTGLAEPVLEA